MTALQKERAAVLYRRVSFERGAVGRTFRDILDGLAEDRARREGFPLVIITDEKKEYQQTLYRHPLFLNQDGFHRVAHIRVNEEAGIPRRQIESGVAEMLSKRAFLSRTHLPQYAAA